jgi:hypothetical protein
MSTFKTGKKCTVLLADDPTIPTVIDKSQNIIDPIHPLLSSAVVPGKVKIILCFISIIQIQTNRLFILAHQ